MKQALLYGAIALLTFLIFAVVYAPASLVWTVIDEDVDRAVPDLEVLTIDGAVWNGNAALRYREFPPATLTWDLAPARKPQGLAAALDASLEGDGLRASGTGYTADGFAAVDAAGYIDSDYINPVSRRYGLTFPGRIDISALTLETDLTWFTAAAGVARWGGGTVILESTAGTQAITLPPLDGELSLSGRDLLLDVTENGNLVIQVTLKPTGWAVVDIKARLLETAGLPFRAGTSPNASAVIAEEKLF